MIIKQKTTYFDSLLLKVVFPYLESGNHRSLLRLAHFWNNDVTTARPPRRAVARERSLRELEGGWQHALRSVARWIQPEQLSPVPVLTRRPARRGDSYRRPDPFRQKS